MKKNLKILRFFTKKVFPEISQKIDIFLDSAKIVTGSRDGHVKVWNFVKGKKMRIFLIFSGTCEMTLIHDLEMGGLVHSLVVTPSLIIACTQPDRKKDSLKVWNTETGI